MLQLVRSQLDNLQVTKIKKHETNAHKTINRIEKQNTETVRKYLTHTSTHQNLNKNKQKRTTKIKFEKQKHLLEKLQILKRERERLKY